MFLRLVACCLAAPLLPGPARAQTHAAPTPDFAHVDRLSGYAPIAIVPGAPGTRPLASAPSARLAAALAPVQAYSDAHAGLALLVWQGGALRYEHYAPGHAADTRYETFSMHKSVLGLLYGAALRDHVIASLDDPAGTYLPEWRADPRGRITLRQLLRMQSGLHIYGFRDPQFAAMSRGPDVTVAALATPADRPPGQVFEYGAVNAQIAGLILDRALKRAGQGGYPHYLSTTLLRPLGTGDAHLWLEHQGGEPRFFAHLQMTARDWLRIGMLVADHGRVAGRPVLPAAWLAQMTTPAALNPSYGLLVWLGTPWVRWRAYGPSQPIRMSHAAPYTAADLVYFDGFGGERVYISPSRALVIVRIGQPDARFDDSTIPNGVVAALDRPSPRQGPAR